MAFLPLLPSHSGIVTRNVRRRMEAMLEINNPVYHAAVSRNGVAIRDLSVELKADKEVGLAAVTQNGMTIRISL